MCVYQALQTLLAYTSELEKELLEKLSYRIADGEDKDKEEKKLIAEHRSTLMWEKLFSSTATAVGGVVGASILATILYTLVGGK